MKRLLTVFFAVLSMYIAFTAITTLYVKGEETNVSSSAKSAYLSDYRTGTVLYEKNANERLPIASMCKIMTLNLCFEAAERGEFSMSDCVCVSENASGMGGSQVFLAANEEYKIEELIKSIVISSANDSCVAMSEKIAGNEQAFVDMMNDKAKEWGMDNTVFTNCTGLPKAGQYSCAKDVAVMFSHLLTHSDYFRFSNIWTARFQHKGDRYTEMTNTNKLVRFYQGCDSGKTGYTSEAGHCIAAGAERNGTRLISVVIAEPDSKTRFKDVSDMFNYGFANYVSKLVVDGNKPLEATVTVDKGKKECVSVCPKESYYIFTKKNEQRNLTFDFTPEQGLRAPVLKGEKVGVITVYENSVEIAAIDVVAYEDVLKATYFDTIGNVMEKWGLCK